MEQPDPFLLRNIERGEPRALEQLARQYAGPVYRYLVRLCGDATLAEDLAQDVAVQLWRALPGKRFPNERALRSWIYTVATNAFRMHHRRRRVCELPFDHGADHPAGEESDPQHHTERGDLIRLVRTAIDELPDPERQALLLKVFGQLDVREVAAITGEPAGTVKWRLSRAYARLRELLIPELKSDEEDHEPLQPASRTAEPRSGTRRALALGAAPAAVSNLLRPRNR